jgi:hypothetical protein
MVHQATKLYAISLQFMLILRVKLLANIASAKCRMLTALAKGNIWWKNAYDFLITLAPKEYATM